jgi:hypothetical protein
MLVVSDIEIEHAATSATSKVFTYLICKQGNTHMFDGNFIEGFETVNNQEGLSILLGDTEPLGVVG